MTDRELMKLALEALDGTEALLSSMDVTHLLIYGEVEKAITALREALAEQPAQQEPVAVARVDDLERGGRVRALAMGLGLDQPLYTSPPASKPWVGLTPEDKHQCMYDEQGFVLDYEVCVDKTEAKLREKNA